MITRDQLSCMWTAAKFRFDETDDEIEKAYWLGKIDAIKYVLQLYEAEPQ